MCVCIHISLSLYIYIYIYRLAWNTSGAREAGVCLGLLRRPPIHPGALAVAPAAADVALDPDALEGGLGRWKVAVCVTPAADIVAAM